ncbi:MAG: sigma-70 family RNA polymerase sigma factor [Opitutaceae bacterium]
MDDIELLNAYAGGKSEAAFTELVQRHLGLVYSAALRQVGGDPHRAQEVAQCVFTDLARKARSVANHPAVTGWLYTSTHYAATKLMRSERRRHFNEQQAAITAAVCDVTASDWQELQPILDAAMHELRRAERDAIVLRFFEQRPMTEVGKILGLSESGARKSVERALEHLRMHLSRRGIVSAPVALSFALTSHAVNAAPASLVAAISQGALASATAGGGVLTFSLMSITKLQAGNTAALFLVAGGFWFSQQRQLFLIEDEIANAERALARIEAETKPVARQTTISSVASRELPGARTHDLATAEKLDPAPKSAVEVARSRAQLDRNYAGLFRRLKLDPLTLEQFRDRLVDRDLRSRAVQTYAFKATGDGIDAWANMTEVLDYIAAGTRDIDERIRSLLGEEKYAHYANYERTLPWRTAFNELATALAPLDPLSEEQIDQLTSWAAAADPNFFIDRSKSGPRIPPQVVTRAEQILTPLQFEKLVHAQASTEAYRQMMVLNKSAIRRETAEPAANPRP